MVDIVVIGAGMMGSAAARHLALGGASVMLIGPDEPDDKASHEGVFASHYDQARITRKLDKNHDWSRLSEAAIDRYGAIDAASGHAFFSPVGSIMAGPEFGERSQFIQNASRIGRDRRIDHEQLRGEDLRARFPYFAFPDGILALYEANNAGWINPRLHVRAEIEAAKASGASVLRQRVEEVIERNGAIEIRCADGSHIHAGKAIVACGAFSRADGLLPQPPQMKVFARTITFFELPQAEIDRLRPMPSLVYVPPNAESAPYILPPVKYADGKTYIKIGGDPVDRELGSQDAIRAWFRGNGDEKVGDFLRDQLLKLMPDLDYCSVTHGSCVTSFTGTGKPLIYQQTDRLIALTGGNGAAAKCADELGRLAAKLALSGSISDESYEADFQPGPDTSGPGGGPA